MSCVPAPAAKAMLAEATRLWPNRSRASDGICGDPRHQATKSDHNTGDAVDLTHDPVNGVDCEHLVESIRRRGIAGLETRVTYIIWNRQICSAARRDWAWRSYDGSNPHTKHAHFSLNPTRRNDTSPWFTPPQSEDDEMTKEQEAKVDELRKRVDHANSELRAVKQGIADIKALLAKTHPGA